MRIIRTNLTWNHCYLLFLILSLGLSTGGCGPRSVNGGTKGTLLVDEEAWPDLQLTVHHWEANAGEVIGFAVTKEDGSFELLLSGAKGPLWLTTGEYRFTLETVGPPINIPKVYTQPETTPLIAEWTDTDQNLEFHAQLKSRGKSTR